jgi:signal transduction histidine kinase
MGKGAADEPALACARARMITRRLPLFSICWLGTTIVWTTVLVVQGLLGPRTAVVVLGGAAALAGGMTALGRVLTGRATMIAVVVGCAALGLATTGVFLLAGGNGDFLAFVLLTLYLASSLFFGWGWRPALVLLLTTVTGWLLALPHLTVHAPTIELVGAILMGSGLSLGIAETHARSFGWAFRHEQERDAIRAREQVALAEAERARAAAEEATGAKDQFLAMVSHELRSPLSAALHWAHMLRHGAQDDMDTRRAAEGVERSVRLAVRLIEDLLDVSRITRGKLRLEMAEADLRGVVATVGESARVAAHESAVILDVRLPGAPVRVRGDVGRLRQVVENLLSNALKFTPRGGRVEVDLRAEQGHAGLVVRDTGFGIPTSVLPHVFEPFRQAEGEAAARHGGLGLGLAIARQLVEAHGGTIEAASEGEGRGATFRVRLPLA